MEVTFSIKASENGVSEAFKGTNGIDKVCLRNYNDIADFLFCEPIGLIDI